MYFAYAVQEVVVPCPEACVAGLNAFADMVSGDPLSTLINLHCTFHPAFGGEYCVRIYFVTSPLATASVTVDPVSCRASFGGETRVRLLGLPIAETARCAPLAVDILPLVDETNCDISAPRELLPGGLATSAGTLTG
jgi:hypothetical protein